MDYLGTLEDINSLIDENQMALLYFGSQGCGVCKDFKIKLINFLNDYPKIARGQIDVEKNFQLAATFSIFTIPGVLLYINGKETIREARYISMMDIGDRIDRYYGMLFD